MQILYNYSIYIYLSLEEVYFLLYSVIIRFGFCTFFFGISFFLVVCASSCWLNHFLFKTTWKIQPHIRKSKKKINFFLLLIGFYFGPRTKRRVNPLTSTFCHCKQFSISLTLNCVLSPVSPKFPWSRSFLSRSV